MDDDGFEQLFWFLHQLCFEPDALSRVIGTVPISFHALEEVAIYCSLLVVLLLPI